MKKRTIKRIFRSVEWMIFVVVIIIISLLFYLAQPVRSSRVLYVPAGNNRTIITHLKARGYDVNALDEQLLRFFGYPQHGWIEIGAARLRKADFLYRLTHAKAALVKVTLIPGETTAIFLDQLAQKLHLDREALQKAYDVYAPYADGVIWPDTYYIPKGITARHLMAYLITRSLKRHEALSKKFFGIYEPKKWFRYVTIASIVQKEAADEKEMPIIAGVIYNRLRKGMPLQMDGALNYDRWSHIKVTAKRIRTDRSAFNTYRHKGLPPRPVGSVSLAAIIAAVKPAKTPYLYFVKGKNGKHIFTKRYSAHIRAMRSVNK